MIKNQINKDGKQHGYWETYYPNGQLYSKGNYVNGKRNGLLEEYNRNGKLWSKQYIYI